MRKIVASQFISLDGVVEAPDQWHFPYFNDEMGQAVWSALSTSDTLLLGRVTYEEFAAAWPDRTEEPDEMVDFMNNTPKVVVSTTLDKVEWKNSTLIKGNVFEEIRKLKEQPGGDIGTTGSVTLIRSLLAEGLIDEIKLLVHPIVVGGGRLRLFDPDSPTVPLKLVESQTFTTGVLNLTYVPADA
ncbi:MAG TPA: dihydrofolate reductase family protein [Streptosporangiaceae bacterium]